MGAEPIDPQVIELAGRVFDLARNGATGELCDYLASGVPVDLTNDRGDTLLILAAYLTGTRTPWSRCSTGAPIPGGSTTAARPRWPPPSSGSPGRR